MKTRDDLRKELGVSGTTINNWVKTGVIPEYTNGKYFEQKEYLEVVESIINNFNKLQSRANRLHNKAKTGSSINLKNGFSNKIIETVLNLVDFTGCDTNAVMFASCIWALRKNGLVKYFFNDDDFKIECSDKEFLIFIEDWQKKSNKNYLRIIRDLDKYEFPENENDFLGTVYESLRKTGEKSRYGAFFTPKELVSDIIVGPDKTVLDPCSGTGTILLGILKKDHEPEKIFLRDIDKTALNIARVNFAIHLNRLDKTINTEIRDVLEDKWDDTDNESGNDKKEFFDFVITNPPWGARFSNEKKQKLIDLYPELKTSESFSISLFNCLKKIKENGRLYFILPESILYVDTHLKIREMVFNSGNNVSITHFGKVFKGVMSKVILLDIIKGNFKCRIVKDNSEADYSLEILKNNGYRPPFTGSEAGRSIIEKILHTDCVFLKGSCKFGLGIVTGNNSFHLKKKFTPGLEPIFTGKELEYFNFKPPKFFIDFKPGILQQVAPLNLFREHKICYRFISNSIITVADEKGSLVLNSINFFIPDESFSLFALSAFLNSPVVTFIYRSLFNSAKVLRNHLENIPVPTGFLKKTEKFEELYKKGAKGEDVQNELNSLTSRLFNLTGEENSYILKVVKNKKFSFS